MYDTTQSETLERELARYLKVQCRLREASIDVFQSLGPLFGPDLSFAVSDLAGVPGTVGPLPPVYQDSTKSGETLPVYRTEAELKIIRDRSRVMCASNEFAIGAIENRVNYVVGVGLKYGAAPKDPTSPGHRDSARRVQDVIDRWSERNNISAMEEEALQRYDTDGEFIIRRFPDGSGQDQLRFVEPEHLRSPNGSASDPKLSFGVETAEDDVVTPVAYHIVEAPLKSLSPARVVADDVVHVKTTGSTSKRGLPVFYPVEANLKRCESLQSAMTSMAKARAKIALIRKIEGLSNATGAQVLSRLTAVRATDPASGDTLNIERLRDGTILTASANTDYEMPAAQLGASDFVEVLQSELRAIASRMVMPEWMFTAKGDAKYDNAFIGEGPTLKSFQKLQRKVCDAFGRVSHGPRASLLWRQLRAAIEAQELSPEDLANVVVSCVGPTLEARNRTDDVNRHKAMVDAGFESVETAQRAMDLDPDTENPLIARNRAGKARPVTDSAAVAEVQKAYYAGEMPRGAALSNLTVLLGFSQENAEKLLPETGCVNHTGGGSGAPVPTPAPAPADTAVPDGRTSLGVTEQERHEYATVFVPLDEATAQVVRSMGEQVADSDLTGDGRESEPHVTVLYGLHDSDPDGARRIAARFGPVQFRLGPVSCFAAAETGKPYDVLKVDVESPDLHRLNAALSDLPHSRTFPEYRPHVTVAYVRPGQGDTYAGLFEALATGCRSDVLTFSDRDGRQTPIPLNPEPE